MYRLDKVSIPSWSFLAEDNDVVYAQLDSHICSDCKLSKSEYIRYCGREEPEDNYNPFTYCDFKPEDFESWLIKDKITWLLRTPCGCEFKLEENYFEQSHD